jgi:hypothetical protein
MGSRTVEALAESVTPASVTASKANGGAPCQLGEQPFEAGQKLLATELLLFKEVYKEQRTKFNTSHNSGGNGLFHSFGIWFILRRLQSPLLVESGVHNGDTSWLMRNAVPSAKFWRLDSIKEG